MEEPILKHPIPLGVDAPFFPTIVLSKTQIRFPWVSGGFLERSGSLG